MFAIRNGNVRTFLIQFRNSRSQMFFEIGALENVAIFTEKHLCWSLFLIFNPINLFHAIDPLTYFCFFSIPPENIKKL